MMMTVDGSSPHERMLAYLREGDALIPPELDRATDWVGLFGQLAEAADRAEPEATPTNLADGGVEHWAGTPSGSTAW
ncbi:hypothetical protein ACWGI8_11555 [Streptomyces sp. NPDC054841]